jgi:hypothetical protein
LQSLVGGTLGAYGKKTDSTFKSKQEEEEEEMMGALMGALKNKGGNYGYPGLAFGLSSGI